MYKENQKHHAESKQSENIQKETENKNIDVIDDSNSNVCSKTGKDCKETEYLELAQRIKAEFENYKKRNAEISTQSFNNGVVSVVTKLLPSVDAFQKAEETIKDENILSGVVMIENQLKKVLKDLGVVKIEALGMKFDPNFHNAILTDCNSDYENDVILEEFQTGYIMGDKVIRYSVVKVNKL